MPTLFRMLTIVCAIVVLAYAAMFAVATFVQPEQREIVQAVALPQAAQDTQLRTGRSVASQLDSQAALLMHRHRHHGHNEQAAKD